MSNFKRLGIPHYFSLLSHNLLPSLFSLPSLSSKALLVQCSPPKNFTSFFSPPLSVYRRCCTKAHYTHSPPSSIHCRCCTKAQYTLFSLVCQSPSSYAAVPKPSTHSSPSSVHHTLSSLISNYHSLLLPHFEPPQLLLPRLFLDPRINRSLLMFVITKRFSEVN